MNIDIDTSKTFSHNDQKIARQQMNFHGFGEASVKKNTCMYICVQTKKRSCKIAFANMCSRILHKSNIVRFGK